MIRYSVIVPYVEEDALLERALASIPRRADVEVIPVQDTEGRGAGWGRNQGLSRAKGEWLLFLDADDFFAPEAFSLLDRHFGDGADVICFGIRAVHSDSLEPSSRQAHKIECLERYGSRPKRIEFYCRYCYAEPWGKLVRRSFVQRCGLRFDETSCANDYYFSVQCGLQATAVAFDPAVLYVVTERPGSVSRQYFSSERKIQDRLTVYWRVQRAFDAGGVPLYPFYGLWMMSGVSPEARRCARDFCLSNGITRAQLFWGCAFRILRKRLRLGVPNCK